MAKKTKKSSKKIIAEKISETSDGASKEIKSKERKQLFWFFGTIIVVFLVFLGVYLYVQSLNKTEFVGVDWYKENDGGIISYHTRVPKMYNGEFFGYHNIYLRNDPSENNIPSEVNISFYSTVVVSQSVEVLNCRNSVLVSSALGQITSLFPFVKNVTIALSDEKDANDYSLPYANCETEEGKENTVFLVRMANETSVEMKGDSCYIINVGKCEDNLIATEKFVIDIIDQLNYQK